MFSFLVFLLLSSCVSELIASEEGYTPSWADLAAKPMSKKDKRRTRRKTERLRAAREKRAIDAHERKDDCAEPFTPTPPARRGRTAAIRKTASTAIKKRPPTPAHPSELQFPEVSRTNPFRLEVNESGPMTPLSPTSKDEEQAFGAFVQERAKEMASEAITHALDAKKDDGALNSDEEMEQAEATRGREG